MGILLFFAFTAGIVTVLSPCVLPVLPVILSGSVGNGKYRPLGIITGFLLTFTALTLSLTFFVRAFGIDPDSLRIGAAVIIILFSAVLIVPALKDRFMMTASVLLSRRSGAGKNRTGGGFTAGLFTGSSLGAVWTPCVGPIMASVITLAVSRNVDAGAFLITLVYALGTSVPLFGVMYGGRTLINRFPLLTRNLSSIQRVFGVLMLATGIALVTGLDRSFQSWLLKAAPGYGSGLTAVEDNEAVKKALEARSSDPALADIPDRNGSDPLTRTSGIWLNSDSLTLEQLKGKVVLIDFWTYSCINCLRTMPYLKLWHERYAQKGLVIVGVHTPEFVFERDVSNLRQAIADIGIEWPVVQDNDYGIWNAFSNRYWPAHYIFDREGKLVSVHYGEGAYAETEKMILGLLGENTSDISSVTIREESSSVDGNPETYLGSERGIIQVPSEKGNVFTAAKMPDKFSWLLEGRWRQEADFVIPENEGTLYLNFKAKRIFLVISADSGSPAELEIRINGKLTETDDVKNGILHPDRSRLYVLFSSEKEKSGILAVKARGSAKLHAFTFL